MKYFLRIARRLRKICAFAATASTPIDALKLSVVGYARGHPFSAPDWISKICRRRFPEMKVRTRRFHGLSLIVDPSDLSQLVILDEILVQHIYNFKAVPFTPDLVLDCGAHIGMFTLLAAGAFPDTRIIAFEPEPGNFVWLKKQLDANQLSIEAIQAAVSIRDGRAPFLTGQGCGGMLVIADLDSSNTISVQTVNLAALISKARCKRLLLKLDIEGAEDTVLPAVMSKLPEECAIFLETHNGHLGWEKTVRFLENSGFIVTPTRQHDIYVDGFAVRQSCVSMK